MLTHSITLYFICIFAWGTSWLAITFQLGQVAEEVSLFYRFALASVILLAFCLLKGRNLNFSVRQHAWMALQGLLLFSSNYVVFYWAANGMTSGLIAVVFSSMVVMNMLGGAIAFGQPVTRRMRLGALLGLAGIATIFWPELRELSLEDKVLGNLGLALLGTLLASLGNIVSAHNQHNNLPVVQTNALGMGYGALALLLFTGFSGAEFEVEWSGSYLGSLFYLSIFSTIIAFGSYLTLVGRIGAGRAAYVGVVFPVVALLISTVFESYRWSEMAVLGLAMVVLGNIIALGRGAQSRA